MFRYYFLKIYCNENKTRKIQMQQWFCIQKYTFTCFTHYIQMVLLRLRDGNLSILLFYRGAKSSLQTNSFFRFFLDITYASQGKATEKQCVVS